VLLIRITSLRYNVLDLTNRRTASQNVIFNRDMKIDEICGVMGVDTVDHRYKEYEQ